VTGVQTCALPILNQLREDHPELELRSVAPVVSGVEPISL